MHIFHKYKIKMDTGKYQYKECQICKKRIVQQIAIEGYQPKDMNWLNYK